LHDVLDISTVSISGDPKLKELSLFCTEDLKQVLNTPLKHLPQIERVDRKYVVLVAVQEID
jgi:hypothetical protein